ncbi:hypothetical protein B0H12DRAFT_1100073, partial [Mycena haematopus]
RNNPPAARRIPGLRLGARDLPVIPATCQADCAPFAPFLNGATCPATDCCSPAFDFGYADCFACVGNATHATDFSIAQEYVDVLITSCLAEGFTLPVLTLPGQNPNRTLFSALPPGASAIPVFPAEGSGSFSTPPQSHSLLQSGAVSQSTVTAPPTSSSAPTSSPSPSSTAPPSAGVRVRSGPYVGVGFVAVLALLL